MKFAFIIDTSPLMQLKRSVIDEPLKDKDSQKAKSVSNKKSSLQSGMTYFEQAVYAIELFVNSRKKRDNLWQGDKYLLALTAPNTFSNCPEQADQNKAEN